MSSDAIDRVKKNLLAELPEDWEPLSVIPAQLRAILGQNQGDEKIRELTLKILSELLDSGAVEAGELTGQDLEALEAQHCRDDHADRGGMGQAGT